nr:MAG TPA: hypothetical protein [Caudoviricetes sp.]
MSLDNYYYKDFLIISQYFFKTFLLCFLLYIIYNVRKIF